MTLYLFAGRADTKRAGRAASKAAGRADTKPTGLYDSKPAGLADTKPAVRASTKPTGRADTKPAAKYTSQAANTTKRLYACKECNGMFSKPALLKRHQLTHTGEPSVNLPVKFDHTGNLQHVCILCIRTFLFNRPT